MISTYRNISNRDEGEETELEAFNPPVSTETANRATGSDNEAVGIIEDDVVGADNERDGGSGDLERGEAGADNAENVFAPEGGVRYWI